MIELRLFHGQVVDLEYLKPDDVHIADIAAALARVCRFAGHVTQHYSVAQHAVLVSTLVPHELAHHALHHDDAEAYLGDVSRNLKHSEFMQGYRVLERRIESTVARALQLRVLTMAEIRVLKAADNVACIFERVTLCEQRPFKEADVYWAISTRYVNSNRHDMLAMVPRLPEVLPAILPAEAESRYLQAHVNTRG